MHRREFYNCVKILEEKQLFDGPRFVLGRIPFAGKPMLVGKAVFPA